MARNKLLHNQDHSLVRGRFKAVFSHMKIMKDKSFRELLVLIAFLKSCFEEIWKVLTAVVKWERKFSRFWRLTYKASIELPSWQFADTNTASLPPTGKITVSADHASFWVITELIEVFIVFTSEQIETSSRQYWTYIWDRIGRAFLFLLFNF